ncbi:hypothetical protein AGRA3207_002690 [Actinomadura graeca]|uniref:Uncharacterized protein n=2 Tax=Actinomadura graeca TaxID=2750812 RepID=A0ABX8R927_9ACTN|nr:hypothetical protein AGRA3207_002690 [Actinomadura graeca]
MALSVGLATTAPVTAGPAHAEASAARPHIAAVQTTDGLDVHRGKYLTLGACQTAGRQGIERGHWDSFQCADGTWPWRWNLWTNR